MDTLEQISKRTDVHIDVIATSIEFIGAINREYGQELGLELWDKISSVLGDDVRGAIMFTLMTGTTGRRFRVTGLDTKTTNPIGIIKTIREYDDRKLGLKEAKDLYDSLKNGNQIVVQTDPKMLSSFRNALLQYGCYL